MSNKKFYLFRILATGLVMLSAMPAMAQHLWTEAELRTKIWGNLSGNVSLDYRTTDGLKATDDWRISAGLDYKVLPWLKAAVAYTFIDNREAGELTRKGNFIPAYWQPKSRFSFSLTGSCNVNRFKISLRERYQYTYRYWQYAEKYDPFGKRLTDEYISPKHSNVLRSRLTVEYNIRKCKFTPYVSAEIYNSLDQGFAIDKTRYSAGGEYKINKKNTVGLYYMFIDRRSDSGRNDNVIGISYQFKL